MSIKALMRDYIAEWLKSSLVKGVGRELEVPRRRDKVISIIGPRRAGKTYYFFQLIGDGRKDSLYINFEDTRLYGIDFRGIRELVRFYVEAVGEQPYNIFLDEVQNVVSWEKAVRELLELRRYHIFVTGSSSKLLSREIATQLRGRTFSYILLPFSFREFLKASETVAVEPITLDESARIRGLLRSYLEYGGFPEVVLEKVEKDRILREYADMILFKDMVERHNLKNIGLARFLLAFFTQNFSRELSVNKILKHPGFKGFGKNTLYSYVDKIPDTVSIFFLNRYSSKVYQRESWPKKVYLCDTGMARISKFSNDVGKLMENTVFLELMRMTNYRPLLEIYYWKDSQQMEVDFLLKEGVKVEQLIQVTYATGVDEIDRRETRALLKASENTGCKNMLIITWDCEDIISIDQRLVTVVPLWKWLLKHTSNRGP